MYDTLPNFAFLQYPVVVISSIKKEREKTFLVRHTYVIFSCIHSISCPVFLHSVFMSFAFQEDFLLFAEVDAILQILEKVRALRKDSLPRRGGGLI